jgi:hypothetical protein
MKTLILVLGAVLSFSALAQTPAAPDAPEKPHLVTGTMLLAPVSLDGTPRPAALAYTIGRAFFHPTINASVYDVSGELLGVLGLDGIGSVGGAACIAPHVGGWVGGVLCGGIEADVWRKFEGLSFLKQWSPLKNLALVATTGLHF